MAPDEQGDPVDSLTVPQSCAAVVCWAAGFLLIPGVLSLVLVWCVPDPFGWWVSACVLLVFCAGAVMERLRS